jgi:anti-sigma B factor antagonist
MDVKTSMNGTEFYVAPSGELNTITADGFAEIINSKISDVTFLKLDFSDCDYISSAGLRVLINTFKKMKNSNGKMVLVNVGETFKSVLENTGLDTVFDVQYKEGV